ncbi:hypothetical protein LPJ78_003264 [Coemansia sp. RSA 989]|nr:hypothetical protein LPJ79_004307 [Coemansia sp. RSA 1821]KAJ1864609.1 hypothetical protein LPJ78_003264 [Coemansia sp. RSA 989]
MYLSSAIAFNLQMTFLRKSRSPLPNYVEYLYYIVPFTVLTIQLVPQYIWASKHGTCRASDRVESKTSYYIIYTIFVQMLIPTLFIFYNVITCLIVIYSLNNKQRKVSLALKQATEKSRQILDDSQDSSAIDKKKAKPAVHSREQQQLMAVRKVYRACIRIALYPLAPLVWWIIFVVFYTAQYYLTLTSMHNLIVLKRFALLNWFASFISGMVNFVVFITDAAVLHVMSEVYKSIKQKFRHKHGFSEDTGSTILGSKNGFPKKPTSGSIPSAAIDDISLSSEEFGSHKAQGYYPTDSLGDVEENRPYASSIAGLHDDAVTRRVRGNADADSFMDYM